MIYFFLCAADNRQKMICLCIHFHVEEIAFYIKHFIIKNNLFPNEKHRTPSTVECWKVLIPYV